MKIEYNNLYTHFILITQNRYPVILERQRVRIEKYITGIVNNNASKLYAIYANQEHVHFLVSRSPKISEEEFSSYSEELLMILVENNVAFEVAEKILGDLKEKVVNKEISRKNIEEEIRDSLKETIENILIEPFYIICVSIRREIKPGCIIINFRIC